MRTTRALGLCSLLWLLGLSLACGSGDVVEVQESPASSSGDPFGIEEAINNDLERASEEVAEDVEQADQDLAEANEDADEAADDLEDALDEVTAE